MKKGKLGTTQHFLNSAPRRKKKEDEQATMIRQSVIFEKKKAPGCAEERLNVFVLAKFEPMGCSAAAAAQVQVSSKNSLVLSFTFYLVFFKKF